MTWYQWPAVPTPIVMPLIPVLCIVSRGILIFMRPLVTPLRFIIWMFIGLVVYFLFGMKNSTNNQAP